MPHFVCARCRRRITPHLVKIPLPPHVPSNDDRPISTYTDRIRAPRMPRGAYARKKYEDEYVFAPKGFVIHPDDLFGVQPHPDRGRLHGCCGLAGTSGINRVCAHCGNEVATFQADCYTDNQVILDFTGTVVSYAED